MCVTVFAFFTYYYLLNEEWDDREDRNVSSRSLHNARHVN